MAPSALDRLPYLAFNIRKVKDAEGHEHAGDGKFTSGGGGSGKGKPGKTKRKLDRRAEAAGQSGTSGKAIQTLLGGGSALDNNPWFKQPAKPENTPELKNGDEVEFHTSTGGIPKGTKARVQMIYEANAKVTYKDKSGKEVTRWVPHSVIQGTPAAQPGSKKPEAKPEAKPETKPEQRPDPKPTPKPEPKKPEAKPEPKPEPKQEKKPEPKTEPKPEIGPGPKEPDANGGEVEVNTGGAFTGYKSAGKVNISVAVVQGGGRVLMGSNIMTPATADDVAVVMYRAAKDGPLTVPEAMFGNEKFRQAMHNLEDLGKVTFVDSGNGREKTMYELGADGKPKHESPKTTPPGARPAAAKRPTGPINTNVTELPEHVPAKTPVEALSRMAKYVPEGTKVAYEGLPIHRMNSLLKGAEHVLGKYGVAVGKMGFVDRAGSEYGMCITNRHSGEILSCGVRKSYAKNPEKYQKEDIGKMRGNQAYNILMTEKAIKLMETDPKYQNRSVYTAEYVENETKKYKEKLERTKNTDHWTVADAVDDPLYATQAHECMHAVYHYHHLGEAFNAEMNKVDGWRIPLTEYATENKKEFFAELGSAITCGMKVHPKLMEAFQNTVRTIK